MGNGHINITACEISHIKKDRLHEMAQPVKTLAPKHSDLNLTLGPPRWKARTGSNKLSSDCYLCAVVWMRQALVCAHTNT